MSDNEYRELLQQSWRRKLTAKDESALRIYLAAHPEAQARWKDDVALNQLLARLPDAPTSTNFTSRVLQMVAKNDRVKQRDGFPMFRWPRWNWVPRIMIASAFVGAALFSVQHHRAEQRKEVAHDIAAVSQAATLPPEWLQDFEAIRHLSQPRVDDELLAALQ